MSLLNIYTGGQQEYLKRLNIIYTKLVEKINKDAELSPQEKSKAREHALKDLKTNKKNSIRNSY
ncbi:hypothetical protein [Niabella aquatica]